MAFDDHAFFSVWYWLLTAVFWSMATFFTHGVPWDLLRRALRHGGEEAEICDRYARACLIRIDAGVARWGAVSGALAGFVLAAMAVMGLVARSELALGLLMMLGPASLLFALQCAEARRLVPHLPQIDPQQLLELLLRRRASNRLWGMFAITLSVGLLGWLNLDRIVIQGGW